MGFPTDPQSDCKNQLWGLVAMGNLLGARSVIRSSFSFEYTHTPVTVRSFVAPAQAEPKPKQAPDSSAGPGINAAITAPLVRLVTDEVYSLCPQAKKRKIWIEDVSVVESSPHVDSRRAYVMVRHMKFATKKSGKKVSKVVDVVAKGVRGAVPCTPAAVSDTNQDGKALLSEEEWEPVDCSSEAKDEAQAEQSPQHFSLEVLPLLKKMTSKRKQIGPNSTLPRTQIYSILILKDLCCSSCQSIYIFKAWTRLI